MSVADNNLIMKASAAITESTTATVQTGVDFGGADFKDMVYRLICTSTGVNTDTDLLVTIQESDSLADGYLDSACFFDVDGNAGEGVFYKTFRGQKRYRRVSEIVSGATASTFTTQVDVVPAGRDVNH